MMCKKSKVKNPIDAFPKCPACLQSFLMHQGIHVFCKFCGWDSIQAYADAGGYDPDSTESKDVEPMPYGDLFYQPLLLAGRL